MKGSCAFEVSAACGELTFLLLEESCGEVISPQQSRALKNINREGWALFKSSLCCVRYLKFRLKSVLVVNWRVEDQGRQ